MQRPPATELEQLRSQVALLDAQRARMARLSETMHALSLLSVQINTLDAEAIKDLAVQRVPALVRARAAALFTIEGDGALFLERHSDPRILEYPRRVSPDSDTLLSRALQSPEILLVPDLDAYVATLSDPLRQCPALVGTEKACLLSPLRSGPTLVGVLVLMDREDGGAFDALRDLPPIQQISQLLGAALRNLQLYAQVLAQSRLDPLTGLLNRRALWERLEAAIASARAGGGALSVLMTDLDRFKQVNDTLGHREGDQVLLEAAAALRASFGPEVMIGRYGGDEFVAVLPGAGPAEAAAAAERLLAQARGRVTAGGTRLACSAGYAGWTEGMGAAELVAAADRALYQAKAAGRGLAAGG